MRVARHLLKDSHREQFFHVVSRVVDRRIVFEANEKEIFLRMMRRLEDFSGVEVVVYCLMGNHFHLLVRIPRYSEREELTDEVVWRRIRNLYSKEKVAVIEQMMDGQRAMGDQGFEAGYLEKQRARMYDISVFMKELKLCFSKWFNLQMGRKGTLWEERFRATLVEGDPSVLMRTAAYIELNPVRAGLVADPKDYRWSSYTEALAGGMKARQGVIRVTSGSGSDLAWGEAIKKYRLYFVWKSQTQSHRKMGLGDAAARQIQENQGQISMSEAFMVRTRYFTDGLIIGHKDFVEKIYHGIKEHLNPNRVKISSRVSNTGGNELYSYRRVI